MLHKQKGKNSAETIKKLIKQPLHNSSKVEDTIQSIHSVNSVYFVDENDKKVGQSNVTPKNI